jgi:hypothetical protein
LANNFLGSGDFLKIFPSKGEGKISVRNLVIGIAGGGQFLEKNWGPKNFSLPP